MPGDVALWPNLTGGEVVDLLGRLRGGLVESRRAQLLERFDLDPTKKARTYSKGNRQKVALVAALASDVDLLLLDEPTSGLDPLMEETFRECIGEEKARGRTVLLSSHILAEAEALSDRVSLIRAGRTVETGTLAELRHLTRTSVRAELTTAPTGLEALPGVHDLTVQGTRVACQVDTAALGGLLAALEPYGVQTLESRPPTLEELFLRHYGAGARPPMTTFATTPAAEDSRPVRRDGTLLRLAARRDRVLLPVWLLVLVASAAGSVGPTRALYPTRAGRVAGRRGDQRDAGARRAVRARSTTRRHWAPSRC